MGLAEGCGGALTCRAPVTARIDAAFEAGGEAAQLRPSFGRRGQEVEIASGGGGAAHPRAASLSATAFPWAKGSSELVWAGVQEIEMELSRFTWSGRVLCER